MVDINVEDLKNFPVYFNGYDISNIVAGSPWDAENLENAFRSLARAADFVCTITKDSNGTPIKSNDNSQITVNRGTILTAGTESLGSKVVSTKTEVVPLRTNGEYAVTGGKWAFEVLVLKLSGTVTLSVDFEWKAGSEQNSPSEAASNPPSILGDEFPVVGYVRDDGTNYVIEDTDLYDLRAIYQRFVTVATTESNPANRAYKIPIFDADGKLVLDNLKSTYAGFPPYANYPTGGPETPDTIDLNGMVIINSGIKRDGADGPIDPDANDLVPYYAITGGATGPVDAAKLASFRTYELINSHANLVMYRWHKDIDLWEGGHDIIISSGNLLSSLKTLYEKYGTITDADFATALDSGGDITKFGFASISGIKMNDPRGSWEAEIVPQSLDDEFDVVTTGGSESIEHKIKIDVYKDANLTDSVRIRITGVIMLFRTHLFNTTTQLKQYIHDLAGETELSVDGVPNLIYHTKEMAKYYNGAVNSFRKYRNGNDRMLFMTATAGAGDTDLAYRATTDLYNGSSLINAPAVELYMAIKGYITNLNATLTDLAYINTTYGRPDTEMTNYDDYTDFVNSMSSIVYGIARYSGYDSRLADDFDNDKAHGQKDYWTNGDWPNNVTYGADVIKGKSLVGGFGASVTAHKSRVVWINNKTTPASTLREVPLLSISEIESFDITETGGSSPTYTIELTGISLGGPGSGDINDTNVNGQGVVKESETHAVVVYAHNNDPNFGIHSLPEEGEANDALDDSAITGGSPVPVNDHVFVESA